MADYSALKAAIRAAIYDNDDQDITGDALQGILLEMVDELGQSYVKPATGIPSTDMAQAVQDDLAAAGTAYQKPSGGIPASDLAAGVIPVVPECVLQYIEQTLTAEQQAQARTNIGAGTYSKPGGGIPASDIASGVIPDVSSFITKSVDDLVNYYLKSETYTKSEVESLIGAISQFHYEIAASTSAVTNPQSNVLYLIGPTGSGADKYEEYVYTNNTWTKIGDTSVDLSGYVTTTALNTALADYTTTANLTTLLAGKQDTISDLDAIRSGASAGATAYQKPSGGIPAADIASGVIPAAPGTLDTDNATAQSVNSSESLSGTVKLHKVAKTGNYNDLLNKPTIPTEQIFSVVLTQDEEEVITSDKTFAEIVNAYNEGKYVTVKYVDMDGYGTDLVLTEVAVEDGFINMRDMINPASYWQFVLYNDESVTRDYLQASTGDLINNSRFVRGDRAIWQGTSATSASLSTKTVSLGGFNAADQAVGVMVVVTFSNTNSAAPNNLMLNVNARGAKPIKRWVNGGLADIDKPENLTGTMAFIYDGTNWVTWYESFDDVDGNCLDAKFGNVTLKQWKPDYTMTEGSYVKGADGLLYEYAGAKYVEVPVGDAERVRFLGLYPKYSSWTNGWAFGKYENGEWVTIESEKFDYDTSQDASYTKEYIKDVPSGATHFRTSSASSSLYALERQFYLYFQTGKPAVSQEEMYSAVHPAVQTSQPAGGMAPNVLYRLGTLTGSVTFSLASPADAAVENEYKFTFDTGGTAPTPTWPNSVTGWVGNCLNNGTPSLSANKHYEVSIQGAYGIIVEF